VAARRHRPLPKDGNRRELYEAMMQVARTGAAALPEQHPAIGCSIKWKSA